MIDSVDLLRELSEAEGVAGFEGAIRAIFRRHLAGDCRVAVDPMGNIFCERPGPSAGPRILIDAHMDELGFIIQHVTSRGFLKFLPLGSWSPGVLAAQRVRVAAGERRIEGVIGSTPPHFLSEDQRGKAPDPKSLFIDIGARSREEALGWGVRVGTWAAPVGCFRRLANPDLLMGKAFDNRVGCAAGIEVMRRAREHSGSLFLVGSVQEEVGGRGADVAPASVDPGLALVLEGPPADDAPGFPLEESQGALGGGVQIRAYDPSMIAGTALVEFALETARARGIPHQVTVRSGGGTNAGRIHTCGRGVPSLVLGAPVRYAHSHAGLIHLGDYRAMVDLALALVERLDAATMAGLLPR